MSNVDNNPYRTWGLVAAEAGVNERARFIRLTYMHLAGAILAFIGLEAALLNSVLAERMALTLLGNGRGAWLLVLGAFVGVSWLANHWANSATSVRAQ